MNINSRFGKKGGGAEEKKRGARIKVANLVDDLKSETNYGYGLESPKKKF